MPIVSCPHCRAELDVDDADFGYRVQCPACRSAFTPQPPAAVSPPPPPPPPPPEPGTLVVTCPECDGKVGVLDDDLGHDMRCPLCDKVFTATLGDRPSAPSARRVDDDGPPPWRRSDREELPRYGDYGRPRGRSRYDDEDDDDRPRRRRRSRGDDDDTPADLIAHARRECTAPAVGLIIIASLGFLGGLLLLVVYGAVLGGAFGNNGQFGQMDEWEIWLNLGQGVLNLFVSGFLIYAGLRMKEAKQYGVCMIACVIAIVPYFSPCCILGLVFGIIGIVKLNDPRVKRGFEANKPEYQGDGYN